jgi:hypothetical protein
LLLYRRGDLTSGEWPEDLKRRALRLSSELYEGIRLFTKKQFGRITGKNMDRVAYALCDAPVGAVRRYLQNNEVSPESIAELIREIYIAIIERAK